MQERFALLRLAALMAPQDEDGLLMQRMEDSNLHRVWRLTDMLSKLRNGGPDPLEMSKMKIDPAMCMKTKVRMTKCQAKNPWFTQKYGNCAIINSNLSGFVSESIQIAR
jgi:hypothetical protein